MMNWTAIILAVTSFFYSQWTREINLVEPAVQTPARRQNFIPVEGENFKAKLAQASKLGTASKQKFWTAYSFDIRPGIAIDAEFYNHGNVSTINGVTVDSSLETRNLGVFLLHEADTITRLELYNLDRQREYSGYPVYWLGRAGNQESLNYLKDMVEQQPTDRVGEHAVQAIAVHDDQRVGAMLKSFVSQSKEVKIRKSAVFWLGHSAGESSFIADVVRNENENLEVRKQAAFALGISKDKPALAALQNLYAAVTPRELKRQIIFATSINENKDAATDFLIKIADSDNDRELKKQALFWLGQKAGERSLKYLSNVVEKEDGETEVQRQAVFALSQKPKDEGIPLLIKIAKTHQKAAVRKQAMFWLGQSDDQRALEFFKEVLSQ